MLCRYTPFGDGGSPMKIYENISKGRVKYPAYIHPDVINLIQQLITPDLTRRLGPLQGGSHDIMSHPWFAEVAWERLAKLDIGTPFVPELKEGAGDTSQFDKYSEQDISDQDFRTDSYIRTMAYVKRQCEALYSHYFRFGDTFRTSNFH